MATVKLTDMKVKNAKPRPDQEQTDIWDSEVRGFSLRVSASGVKSFCLKYRNAAGRERRVTIGRYPDRSLAVARKEAQRLRGLIAGGEDLSLAAKDNCPRSLRSLIDEFLQRHASKLKTGQESARLLRREVLPILGDQAISEIRKSDIVALIDSIVDRGRLALARNLFSALRKLFRWAVARTLLDHSPCEGLESPAPPRARERVLTADELRAIWRASVKIGGPFESIIKLLLLTGQRRAQIAHLKWSWIDFDANTILFPGSAMKGDQQFLLPPSNSAMNIISSIPRFEDDDRVFPARNEKSVRSFSGFSKCKQRLDRLSGVSGWRLHDLRRTMSTEMNRMGIDPFIVERVLDHTIGGVAGIYNRHTYLPEKRAALRKWADHLEELMAVPGQSQRTPPKVPQQQS